MPIKRNVCINTNKTEFTKVCINSFCVNLRLSRKTIHSMDSIRVRIWVVDERIVVTTDIQPLIFIKEIILFQQCRVTTSLTINRDYTETIQYRLEYLQGEQKKKTPTMLIKWLRSSNISSVNDKRWRYDGQNMSNKMSKINI